VTKEEARTFADRSVATLADAVESGWPYPSELKEPDFDALRGRADFLKLVAEVEAKSRPKAKPRVGSPPKRRLPVDDRRRAAPLGRVGYEQATGPCLRFDESARWTWPIMIE
jgi:hypothetical protein